MSFIVDEIIADENDIIFDSPSVNIGSTTFPSNDGEGRSQMSFSSTGQTSFLGRASLQIVDTPSATILPTTTIVGVTYDGPVNLILPDSANARGLHIVDEGGFSSESNPITVSTSGGVQVGDLTVTNPFSSLRANVKPNGEWITKKPDTIITPGGGSQTNNPDGSITVIQPDGTSTTSITIGDVTNYTTVNIDGSVTIGFNDIDGTYSFTTTFEDGSTYTELFNGTYGFNSTVNVDGSKDDEYQIGNFSIQLSFDPDGNLTSFNFG